MKNRWIILVSSLCGAVVGVLIVRNRAHLTARIPAFGVDRAAFTHGRFLAVTIPWILFSLYWEIAAKGAATAKSSESSASRAFHVLLANVAVLLVIAPIRGWGRFLPASFVSMAAGIIVELLGLFLAIWALARARPQLERRNFDQGGTRVDPLRTVSVAETPYLHGIAGDVCGRRAHYR